MRIDFAALTAPCNAAFGQSVLYAPASGGSFEINGVFDEAYRDLQIDRDGIGVSTVRPCLGIQPGDLPVMPQQGDQLTIVDTGEVFVVKEYRPDSHGWAILLMNFIG
jgi:hypothetical protein